MTNAKIMRFLCTILCIFACFRLVASNSSDNVLTMQRVQNLARKVNKTVPKPPLMIAKNQLQMDVLDQLLKIYVLNSSNVTCRRASEAYRHGLINFEPWAMKMLDASSKFQSGIMEGNFFEFGSFQECIDVETNANGGIRGKHCTVPVLPSERFMKKVITYRDINDMAYKNIRLLYFNTTYKWSVCIPDACGPKDVVEHFRPTINKLFEGLEIAFLDDEVHCNTYEDDIDKPYEGREITVLAISGILVFVVATSTCIELYKSYYNIDAKGYEVIFSIASNTRYILKRNKSHKKMACLNGIRVMSIILVVFGHRYLLSWFHANVNSFAVLDWEFNMSSQIILRGSVAVDSFLLLSAALLAYNFLVHDENGHSVNLPMYYLHRYLRLTPSYAFWILIIACFSHRFGKGPMWDAKWHDVQQPCKDYWWSALLYAQSYVNPKEVCILQSWYLSIDTFYYVLAPVFLILLIRYKMLGFITIFLLYITSVSVSFAQAWNGKYPVQGLVDSDLVRSPYFTEHYTIPHHRASPYILGIILGYMLFKTRDKKFHMSPLIVALGWVSCVTIAVVTILSNRVFLDEDYEYDQFGNAFYLASHRSGWVVAVGWIIWACVHGYGGAINTFLSSDVFAILGKVTYSVYIVHMQFQYYDFGALKTGLYFSNMIMVQKAISDVVISFLIGFFLTVMVECPIYRLSLYIFSKKGKQESQDHD